MSLRNKRLNNLDALIARRDALLSELKEVRAAIKLAQAALRKPKDSRTPIADKGPEMVTMRRNGMTYRAIAKAVGSKCPQYVSHLIWRTEYNERQTTE